LLSVWKSRLVLGHLTDLLLKSSLGWSIHSHYSAFLNYLLFGTWSYKAFLHGRCETVSVLISHSAVLPHSCTLYVARVALARLVEVSAIA
jgi:hypothetical protein